MPLTADFNNETLEIPHTYFTYEYQFTCGQVKRATSRTRKETAPTGVYSVKTEDAAAGG